MQCDLHECLRRLSWCKFDHVHIRCGPSKSVTLCDNETSNAVHACGRLQGFIKIAKERAQWLVSGNLLRLLAWETWSTWLPQLRRTCGSHNAHDCLNLELNRWSPRPGWPLSSQQRTEPYSWSSAVLLAPVKSVVLHRVAAVGEVEVPPFLRDFQAQRLFHRSLTHKYCCRAGNICPVREIVAHPHKLARRWTYSTVTDFARLRGWSTSHPRRTAMW